MPEQHLRLARPLSFSTVRLALLALAATGVSSVTACTTEVPCTTDAECQADRPGARCNALTGLCLEGCVAGQPASCAEGFFCDAAGVCTAQLAAATACTADGECQAGLHCDQGACCAAGKTCCRSEVDCASELGNTACDGVTGECVTLCTGEDRTGCANGHHCESGVCTPDAEAGGACDEASDCATGMSCGGGLCCATGATCCNRDGQCETASPGFACDLTSATCFTSCAVGGDAACLPGLHCDGNSCVDDLPVGQSCVRDAVCVAGNKCNGGQCCPLGRTCCGNDGDCAARGSSFTCDTTASVCRISCAENGDADCQAGLHCEQGLCVAAAPLGGFCEDDSHCADAGSWCRNQVCCADGEECCSHNYDCGTCEKCDTTTNTCVLQNTGEDLKDECTDTDANCDTDVCSGTDNACIPETENDSCGTCARCDDSGQCVGVSSPHADDALDCPLCGKCGGGSCVAQTSGEDIKDQCAANSSCTNYLYGLDAGTCKVYSGASAQNGNCSGSGYSCGGVTIMCSGAGAANSPEDNCPSDSLCTVCPTGQLATSYNDPAETCALRYEQMSCPANQGCNPAGACAAIPASCNVIKTAHASAPSGVYRIDPDGPGGQTPFDAYCDMTNNGGGWTLVAKIQGTSWNWHYDSPNWTNPNSYFNHNDLNTNFSDARMIAFERVGFTDFMVVMRDSTDNVIRYLNATVAAQTSMRAALATNTYIASSAGRTAWKGLLLNGSLQSNCNREGLNAVGTEPNYPQYYARARLGIVSNDAGDCVGVDSAIGVGFGYTQYWACSYPYWYYYFAGNVTGQCSNDNGQRIVWAHTMLYVR